MGAISPISPQGLLAVPKGMTFARLKGEGHHAELGDLNTSRINWETESVERYDNRRGKRVKSYEAITQISGTFETELVMQTDRVMAIAAASNEAYFVQAAQSGLSKVFNNVKAGHVLKLPHEHVEDVVLTDGSVTPVSYVEGTHYEIDEEAGIINILAIPATADSTVESGYGLKAVTADDKKLILDFASNLDIRAEIMIRGTNDVGRKFLTVLHDVQLKADGRTLVQDGDEFVTVNVTGTIFADTSKPQGKEYGYEVEL